jgi:O-antigen/teichoic acid export membrane protein
VKRNILANYIGAAFAILSPILALPYFLAVLGPKLWGLASFIALLQVVMGMLDAGIAQALIREFSIKISDDSSGNRGSADLLYGFERLYWGFAAALALIFAAAAPIVASRWLHLDGPPVATGELAVYGAAVMFAVQFPGSLYRSLLIGGRFQYTLNVITVVSSLLRYGGGVLIVSVCPGLPGYIVWFAAIGLLETTARGMVAWRKLQVPRRGLRWRQEEMRCCMSRAAAMSGAVILGTLSVQMDKIVICKMLPIQDFGSYSIASTVAMGVLQLSTPISQASLPRIVHAVQHRVGLRELNIKIFACYLALVASGAAGFLLCGKAVLLLWLKRPGTVELIYPIVSIMLCGSAMNMLAEVGYANWLASGRTKMILLRNAIALSFSVVVIPLLVARYAMQGAAMSWVFNTLIVLAMSSGWFFRRQAGEGEGLRAVTES